MIIFGTKFLTWGSQLAPQAMRCGNCGTVAQFIMKKGMTFFTIYFVIPIFPVSGVRELLECPNCKTRYDGTNPPPPAQPSPFG